MQCRAVGSCQESLITPGDRTDPPFQEMKQNASRYPNLSGLVILATFWCLGGGREGGQQGTPRCLAHPMQMQKVRVGGLTLCAAARSRFDCSLEASGQGFSVCQSVPFAGHSQLIG